MHLTALTFHRGKAVLISQIEFPIRSEHQRGAPLRRTSISSSPAPASLASVRHFPERRQSTLLEAWRICLGRRRKYPAGGREALSRLEPRPGSGDHAIPRLRYIDQAWRRRVWVKPRGGRPANTLSAASILRDGLQDDPASPRCAGATQQQAGTRSRRGNANRGATTATLIGTAASPRRSVPMYR